MKHIIRIVACFAAALTLFSCGKDESGETIAKQQSDIRNYITTRINNFVEANFSYEDSIYIYKIDFDENNKPPEGWVVDEGIVAAKGDEVHFWYVAYEFSTAPYEYPFTTNIPSLIDQLMEAGIWEHLNPELWQKDVYKATLGSTRLLSGLEKGLIGSFKGEHMLLFLTDDKAYNGASVPGLTKGSAVMFEILIQDIVKQ